MRRGRLYLLLPVFALISGCSESAQAASKAPADTAKPIRFEFVLDNQRYAISLPDQAGMRQQTDAKQIIFDARRGQRLQKIMILGTATDRPSRSLDRRYRLRNGSGNVVRYRQDDNAGSGSGGGLAQIEGEFEVGLYTLFLYCSDQGEWAQSPDWCLEYLETLELTPAPSGSD